MAFEVDHSVEADWIEGLPLPREQTALIGHAAAAEELHEVYRSGRMHHAVLLTGPKGIGKATLAFRFARYVLSHPDPFKAPEAGAGLLPASPRVQAQVATGAHPNLLHLKRPYDDKAKKVKTQLTVDEVRRTVSFFGNAAGMDGHRIAIVDAADDMNASAANALLKMLEEPPKRSLFLVLSHAPGRLLPTIRSRCRRVNLEPLSPDQLDEALETLDIDVNEADKPALTALAEGSVRRAIECIEREGLILHGLFRSLMDTLPRLDRGQLYRFATAVAGRKGADNFDIAADLARAWLSEQMRIGLRGSITDLNAYATAWDEVNRIVAETDGINLDRRQAVVSLMQSLAGTARK
ncbi:DNA polymerase III subunit delta' [Oryzibacter oryziterrae]|uniref:DNA polymerase III subunit delta' n=1 Tax=Oryzibacter oryziterrae TaxID=2766474 RepID=UPI001F3E9CEA|nr:DNA polymerase III subunit delta' [Oryzibacter oryziterrae]